MNTNGRRSLALTLSILILGSCGSATPSDSPNASASTASEASPASPSAPPSAAPSSAPTATPGPTPTPGPLVVAWHRSPDVAAPKDSWWSWAGGGQQETWTKFGGTYIFAIDTQGYDDGPTAGPQVWLSEDLAHWRRATIPQPPDQHLSVTAVTLGGPGLVAIGTDVPDNAPIEMFWTSTDGSAWNEATATDTGLTAGQLWLLRATAAGDVSYAEGPVDVTRFLGTAMDPDTSRKIIEDEGGLTAFTDSSITNNKIEVWQVTGTSAWHKIATLPKSTGAALFDAARGSHGYVLVGCDNNCSATFAWTSTNAVDWQSTKVTTFDNVNTVMADQSGFIAVGQRVTGTGCAVAELEIYGESWTSSDGRTWKKMKDEAQFNHSSINLLIPRGRTLVGVGQRWVSDHAVPTVWTTTLPANSVSSGPGSTPPPASGPSGCGD